MEVTPVIAVGAVGGSSTVTSTDTIADSHAPSSACK